jgi:hypothetical protein
MYFIIRIINFKEYNEDYNNTLSIETAIILYF